MDKMKSQSQEFDAASKLNKSIDALFKTAVVDDDYPTVRSCYEGALFDYIAALKNNGRFKPGNIYGVNVNEGY